MTAQERMESLVEATRIIIHARCKTQFDYPLADEKLIRACGYLREQVKQAEREVWSEAGLLEESNAL